MKKFLVVAAMFACAGAALAAGYKSISYYQIDSSTPPTPLTVGLPLDVQGQPLKQITVTVADYDDGGNRALVNTDDDYIKGFQLLAYRKVAGSTFGASRTDRDAGWVRQPELDIAYASAAADNTYTTATAAVTAAHGYSVSFAGNALLQHCNGMGNPNVGTDAGTSGQDCFTYQAGGPNNSLAIYPQGSQLYYQARASSVQGLDGGYKPFIVTIDGVY